MHDLLDLRSPVPAWRDRVQEKSGSRPRELYAVRHLRCGMSDGGHNASATEGQDRIRDKIVTGLSATTNTSKIVAFLCSRSAARAMAAAGPKSARI